MYRMIQSVFNYLLHLQSNIYIPFLKLYKFRIKVEILLRSKLSGSPINKATIYTLGQNNLTSKFIF
jgi:hypothetical protein